MEEEQRKGETNIKQDKKKKGNKSKRGQLNKTRGRKGTKEERPS